MAISVDYYEMQGWPREWADLDCVGAERKLMCAWDERFTLANEITTYSDNIYPYLTVGAGLADIYAEKVAIEPFAAQTQAAIQASAEYDWALVTVRYSSLSPGTADLVTEWIEPAMITLPGGRARWEDDDRKSPVENRESILMPALVYNLKYHRAAAVSASIPPAIGKINSGAVATKLLGLTFDANTLLYCVPRISRTLSMAGVTLFNIHHRCAFKSAGGNGWNWHWNAETASWVQYFDRAGDAIDDYVEGTLPL